MSRWTPCKRRDFIRRIQALGFDGPYSGTRHQFMLYEHHRLAIPSNAEYSVPQLRFMLQEIERLLDRPISADEWAKLRTSESDSSNAVN